MKKWLSLVLVSLFLLMLAGCGGNTKNIEGSWKLTDGESNTYGIGLMSRNDGTMYYGWEDPEDYSGAEEYQEGFGSDECLAFHQV